MTGEEVEVVVRLLSGERNYVINYVSYESRPPCLACAGLLVHRLLGPGTSFCPFWGPQFCNLLNEEMGPSI